MQQELGKSLAFGSEDLFTGYMWELDGGIIISAITSKYKGQGNFSRLLEDLKKRYLWIKIPTPSEEMRRAVIKKGFISKEEFFPYPFDCIGEVLFWEKK